MVKSITVAEERRVWLWTNPQNLYTHKLHKYIMVIKMVKWDKVLAEVDEALEYFSSQGVKPTLRTLFYYLVSKNIIPNTRSSYKQLSRKLVNARKQGRYEWDFLEDKTRLVYGNIDDGRFRDDEVERFERTLQARLEELDIDKMLAETFDYLQPFITVGRWAEQPYAVEIWIEKEALSSTIQNWTEGLGVLIRVNRGYSSWTFIYNNVQALKYELEKHDKIIILYLGDLDPSGVDIERFLKEALDYFGLPEDKVQLIRLAVTPEQVRKYNLPPRPEDAETLAKLQRDPRYKNYEHEYIVELDSLVAYVPEEFRRILIEAIYSYWDREIYEKLRAKAEELRSQVKQLLEDYKAKAKQKILDMLS